MRILANATSIIKFNIDIINIKLDYINNYIVYNNMYINNQITNHI